MNYTLAKQLKENGFPQKTFDDSNYINIDGVIGTYGYNGFDNGRGCFYIPTLSELIESCGNDFKSLERASESKTWWANGFNLPSLNASTPSEAVAKLWLSLNPISSEQSDESVGNPNLNKDE